MPDTATRGARRRVTAAVLAALIFPVTMNLRPAITTVGPVLTDIGETYRMSESLLGLLGALPLLMFAAMSLFAAGLASRVGLERALWYALLAIAAGIAMRSLLGIPGLWIGTALATAAIAVGNVLVPVVVRNDYRDHVALATGIYAATMGLAAAAASALSATVAEHVGWQQSLLLWAIPAVIVAVLWLLRVRVGAAGVAAAPPTPSGTSTGVWRSASAWWLTAFMGVQSAAFYFMITWLPAYVVEHGGTMESAGLTLFWYQIVGITAGFITPLLMRGSTQVRATLVASVPILMGFVGLILFPEHHLWWSMVLGIGSGISLVVSLSLISVRGKDARHTGQLSSMVQSVGYLIAALAPFLAGALTQVTGTLTTAFTMMAGCALVQCLVAFKAGKGEPDGA